MNSKSTFTSSNFFKIVSQCILGIGFVGGIICGYAYKLQKLTYEFPSIQKGEKLIEVFNSPLMIGIWVSSILLFISFWGLYCHLKNQEDILNAISNTGEKKDYITNGPVHDFINSKN